MQVTGMLAQVGGLESMARELGVSESDIEHGADALLPAILGGLRKQALEQPGGFDGLGGLLTKLGGDGLMDEVLAPAPTDVGQGNVVLEEIFGSKEVSRAVAAEASDTSGLDAALLRKMLPMVAMLVTGFMAKQSSHDASAEAATPEGGGGLLGGLLGGKSTGGLGGVVAMLDADGDGNPLDDIVRMMGK